jgi:hypothetical protein
MLHRGPSTGRLYAPLGSGTSRRRRGTRLLSAPPRSRNRRRAARDFRSNRAATTASAASPLQAGSSGTRREIVHGRRSGRRSERTRPRARSSRSRSAPKSRGRLVAPGRCRRRSLAPRRNLGAAATNPSRRRHHRQAGRTPKNRPIPAQRPRIPKRIAAAPARTPLRPPAQSIPGGARSSGAVAARPTWTGLYDPSRRAASARAASPAARTARARRRSGPRGSRRPAAPGARA